VDGHGSYEHLAADEDLAVCRCLEPLLGSRACDGAGPSTSAAASYPEVDIRLAKRRAFFVLLCFLAVLPLAAPSTSAPPSIESKHAEAQQVLAQIQQLDADLGLAVEAYNAAQVQLDRIRAKQRVNERRLRIARANLARAQANLDARLVELYVSGEPDIIEVLLGATSLDELLDRLDTANRVSS
jgi:hypothetical protein